MSTRLCLCLCVNGYYDRVKASQETWIKRLNNDSLRIVYISDPEDPEAEALKLSGSILDRVYMGLKQVLSTVEADWYMVLDAGTYPQLEGIQTLLASYDPKEAIMLANRHRFDLASMGEGTFSWHEGSYILSRSALVALEPHFEGLCKQWKELCLSCSCPDYDQRADMSLHYLIFQQQLPIKVVQIDGLHNCEYENQNCPWGCWLGPGPHLTYKVKTDLWVTKYVEVATTPSDIHEHIPLLANYARQCQSIVECGVRGVCSTWAFVKGLLENGTSIKRLLSIDCEACPNLEPVALVCKEKGIDFAFRHANDVAVEIPMVDLVFIDTWHVYGHLKRELAHFHSKARQYIILHDTTVDEWFGETYRCGMNFQEQSRVSGYPINEILCGLWPAIDEFLKAHPEWALHERLTNCNGLTVLKRVNPVAI